MLGFKGAGAGQVEVVGLCGAERGQPDAELVEVEGGDLLVEVLGQHVDLVLVLAVVGEELDLGQHLVVKEALMTKLGWPVAPPKLTSRPLAKTISRLPSGKTTLSTCGLTSCQ